MKQFNIAGVVVLAFLWISAIFRERYGASFDFSMLDVAIVLILIGVALLGLDRWIGDHKYGVFLTSLLYVGYWASASYMFLMLAALWAFAMSFGPAGNLDAFWMYLFLANAGLYAILGIANLAKFFRKLFTLSKLA